MKPQKHIKTLACLVMICGSFGVPQIKAQWIKVGGASDPGSGVDDIVYAMCSNGNNIYAGGAFTTAYDGVAITVNHVAVWNSTTGHWSAITGPSGTGVNGTVTALAYNSGTGTLYVGGEFTSAGGIAVRNLAKYSGGVWSSVDGVANGGVSGATNPGTAATAASGGGGYEVQALALDPAGNLYVGGNFTAVNGTGGYNNIAKYNGATWSTMSGGLSGTVFNAAIAGSTVASVYAITYMNGVIYAGGQFTTAGGTGGMNNISQWNGASWSALSTGGLSGVTGAYDPATPGGGKYTGWAQEPVVMALAPDLNNNILYVGGEFLNVGNAACTNIGAWTAPTSTWSAVGTGMTHGNQDGAQVYALLVYNGGLLAAGDFWYSTPLYAAYAETYFIAYWDYNKWSGFGPSGSEGLEDDVQAIAVSSGGNLYAGGIFQHNEAGTSQMNYVAQWSNITTLPIELYQFNALYNEDRKEVDLLWQTESETNNRIFTIEKTRDGDNWTTVCTKPGAGNSSSTLTYRSKDNEPWQGTSYYRLKQTDFNGNFTYSKTVPVNTKESSTKLMLAPNPARENTTLSFLSQKNDLAEIRITDCSGRIISVFMLPVAEGLNSISLDILPFEKGFYNVTLSDSQQSITAKLIISK
ncbi:MAG: T9SS type A sorting domain-containing protein [Bacteroidia bacterium]